LLVDRGGGNARLSNVASKLQGGELLILEKGVNGADAAIRKET
jgi:hypothetical protein